LKAQTPAQTWVGGKPISLAVAFTDPQNQALTYSARLSNGQPLPTWLTFSTANDTFSGTAATTAQTLSIVVTAKDTGLLSTTDTFTATVIGTPVLAIQTATQTWTAGKSFSLSLPAGTFTDPQGQHMTYAATQSSGLPLPAWLGFNPATDTFSGTAPATAQTLALRVTATDSSGLTESDTFAAVVQSGAPTPIATKPAISLSAQTAKQTWSDGQSVTLVLPGNTFTDALGLNMTFVAYEVSGPNVTSWLHFNAAADEFYGTVPSNATGTIGLEVVASDAQHVTAADLFSVTFTSGANHAPAGVTSAMYGPSGMPVPVTMLGMLGLPS
jgi:hypothetical protein